MNLAVSDLTWIERSGRAGEDLTKFHCWVAVHGSGQILASVGAPCLGEEFKYWITWYCTIPKRILADANEAYYFMDEDSAQRYVEKILTQFNPVGPPEAADQPCPNSQS